MKIALIIYGSLDTLSGGYLYDRQLVAHLRAAGNQVDIVSLPWRTYAAHLLDNRRIGWIHKIAQARYDVILQDELNHPSLFLLNGLLRRKSDAPIISIVHHLRLAEDHPTALLPLYRMVERCYLQSVDGFIYNSHTTRRIVEAQIGRTMPHVVAFPAGDHRRVPVAATLLNRITNRLQQEDTLQLLFVGNLMARKGLHVVLNALARQNESHWHLHVVGSHEVDPDYSRQMRHRASDLNLTARITWHGRVSDETLAHHFAASDLLVMPSYEGFGIVYLEAMAFGLPVLAANAGAAPELITPGINGYLIDPADDAALARHIALLQRNRVQLAALAFHARQRYAAHPTWTESMQTILDWLHEAISGSPLPHRGTTT